MNVRPLKKILFIIWGIFILSSLVLFFVGGEQLDYVYVDTGDMVQATNEVGQLTTGVSIEQPFSINATEINAIWLSGTAGDRTVGGTMEVAICDLQGNQLFTKDIDMALFSQSNPVEIEVDSVKIEKDTTYLLKIYVKDGSEGSVPTLYYGSSISLARGQAELSLSPSEKALINGNALDGILCFQVAGRRSLWVGTYYWYIFGGIAIVLLYFTLRQISFAKKQKETLFIKICSAFRKYSFLLEQLVSRDFKSKYKRSILGVLWSFLNPMLMMTVQYIVFSTIFRSEIDNFAVYLLTGIVCYNFFSEVTNMALTSIVGNASLITKVYIPKYIYPVSRALSSMINLGLSLIPLLVVMLFTKTPITSAILLLPFAILCLFALSLGVGMILASSMVFFRDTQFLWNVLSMVWMYMTPIFYPESIITGWLSTIFKINPLYHIIRFSRIILLDGISPEPKAYVFCLLTALIPLIIGAVIFRKTEDRFVLYL